MRSVTVTKRRPTDYHVLYYEDENEQPSYSWWFAELMHAMSSAHMWMAGMDALGEGEVMRHIEAMETRGHVVVKQPTKKGQRT